MGVWFRGLGGLPMPEKLRSSMLGWTARGWESTGMGRRPQQQAEAAAKVHLGGGARGVEDAVLQRGD